jgi:hypothetical protein
VPTVTTVIGIMANLAALSITQTVTQLRAPHALDDWPIKVISL